ncbi:MAG: fluoride efflux transporter CrcB [Ferruginibacter sp.]
MFKNLLLAGLGGCLGSMMRYATGLFFKPTNFPVATLLVNIAGSLVIGIVIGLSMKDVNFSNGWKIFLATGICGGFTTFSAFSAENLQMLQQGKYHLSLLYICSSIIFGIAAAWVGFKLVTN